jgi:hypothetical protein
MARLARTSAARNSSVSPGRALRRPIRIFWPEARSRFQARRREAIIGLVSGLYIQRAPIERHAEGRIGGAAADLTRASTTIDLAVRRHDRARRQCRRSAPITTSASRGSGPRAAPGRHAASPRPPTANWRVIVMSWFRTCPKSGRTSGELCRIHARGNLMVNQS